MVRLARRARGDHSFNPGRFLGGLTETHYPKGRQPQRECRTKAFRTGRLAYQEAQRPRRHDGPGRPPGQLRTREPVPLRGVPEMQPRCPGVHNRGSSQVFRFSCRPREDCLCQRGPERRTDAGWSAKCGTTHPQHPPLERGPRQSRRHLVPRSHGLEFQRAHRGSLPAELARAFLRLHRHGRTEEAQRASRKQFPPTDAILAPFRSRFGTGTRPPSTT